MIGYRAGYLERATSQDEEELVGADVPLGYPHQIDANRQYFPVVASREFIVERFFPERGRPSPFHDEGAVMTQGMGDHDGSGIVYQDEKDDVAGVDGDTGDSQKDVGQSAQVVEDPHAQDAVR